MRIGHVANPCAPSSIDDTVAESNEDIHDNEDGKWRVERNDEIRDQAECRCDHAYASLAETDMQGTVDKGRHGVSDEWRQEDERDNGVSEIVMSFQLNGLLVISIWLEI